MKLEDLPSHVLSRIFLCLDAESLAKLQLLDSRWNELAGSNELWRMMLKKRFHVQSVNNKHLMNTGAVEWKNVFSNWVSIRRMPSSPFSGQRFPVLGRNADTDVYIWLTIRPSEDCHVSSGHLNLRLIIQNVMAAPLTFESSGISFTLKDGQPPAERSISDLGLYKSSCTGDVNPPELTKYPLLEEYDFIIYNCQVRAPPDAVIEPDALERFSEVQIPAREHKTKSHRLYRCEFVESEIWKHYECLPGGFWVFT
ncbi:hypothetical protein NDN08_008367 [Rhodosorus marinus]|uniref:F-box domain-containing protein n=1 Tax=Rhodosorus marinus TaxID=101924 RepID=A0AAV8V4R3_9RHOD|nr:hypothetical protein NDN08_008367 [Rhodosorus marinus]